MLFESHSDVMIPAGFVSKFFGTIFTPFGGVSMPEPSTAIRSFSLDNPVTLRGPFAEVTVNDRKFFFDNAI